MSWRSPITETADRPWAVGMTWHDLLFMHWPIEVSLIRRLIPAGLEIDLYDGRAWIAVVPFRMTGVKARLLPDFSASNFPEVNVRTYVRGGRTPGVWFFSLDAAERLAVWAARRFFHLPYHFAAMSALRADGSDQRESVLYTSRRVAADNVTLECSYRPCGPVFRSESGSLEHWLTERYCLFSADRRGRLFKVTFITRRGRYSLPSQRFKRTR